MKNTYLLSLTAGLLLGSQAFAQKYVPTEQRVQMDRATASAWIISADEEPIDDLRKSFARYTREKLDVKSKKNGRDMMVAKEASIPRIASHPGDLKAKFFREGDETKIAVAFMPGYDISLNTSENPDEMENLRKFAKNFVKYYKTEKLTEQVEDQEKRQKSIESDYKRNEREYKKLQKNLAKIDKKLDADKTSDSKRFELKNEKIEDEARIMALDEIMMNQEREIDEVADLTQEYRSEISHLETLFAEPMAGQNTLPTPEKADEDVYVRPAPTSSPDIDY